MSLEIARQRIQTAKEKGYTILDLSYLDLKGIPQEIAELTQLTHLFLRHNQIEEIEHLEGLKELKVLSLGGNRLRVVPISLLDLDLPIHWGDLRSLHFTFSLILLKNLSRVRALGQSCGQALSLALALAPALDEAIDQAHTQVRSLNQAHARYRNLSRARILDQELYLALDRARALTVSLDLDQVINQALAQALAQTRALYPILYEAQSFGPAKAKAGHQALVLQQAQALDEALSLHHDLALDQVQTLHQTLALDQALSLDLDQALVLALDQALDLDQALALALDQTLDLDQALDQARFNGVYLIDNPFEAPPPEIIQKGNQAIHTYLVDFSSKKSEPLNEVKVILVGEGASGKTSLVKRLLGENFDENEKQTHGIKIIKEHFNFQRQKFNVNFWDFGGQEIMHATHQFFLTKRCLYLLVLDSRKDEKAEYWLHYIQSFGRDAPVVMVLNKIDEYPSFDVNRKFLSKKYGNIQAYHKVSCRTDEGLTDLKKYLMDLLWNLELRSTTFPREWLKVKMSLETMKEDYISYAQYQALCKKNQVVKPDSQNVLLDLLNDLGVILNYERLRWYDTQVLNPLWLTNSVYRIINSPSLAKTNGSFFLDNLNTIINDERYQDNKHLESTGKLKKSGQKLSKVAQDKFLFIVAMMKQFELLFEFAEHRYLVPELLPIEENTYQFKTGSPILSLVIEYVDFLPTAIIPRLMVKMHKYIYNNQIWKTGMVLEEASIFHSIANIVLDKEEKKIYIDIQGQRGRDFLTMIRETVKEINSTYQNLEITEWVPLPSSDPTDPTLVSYKELLGYEKAGWEEYLSGELLKKFQVSELLNGIEKPEFRKQDISCRIFVSYAEKDHQHKEELIKHLMPLVRLNKATLWDKTCIDAGKEWMQEIYDNLDKADIVLCLVSSSFIASDFCYGEELGRAMAAHKAKKKVVIPIKAREANWDNLEIATLQELPRNNWLQGVDDDKSWVEIAKGIEAAIDGLKGVEGVGCK